MERFIVYINARKEIKSHALTSVSESEEHFQGICSKTQWLKTFRKDRVLSEHQDAETADAALGSYSVDNYRHLFPESKPKKLQTEICFTGFKKDDKERLIAVATSSAMSVRSSVTQNLHILCCGYNAGPTKVNAARMKGIIILDEPQFLEMLQTGEIPDA